MPKRFRKEGVTIPVVRLHGAIMAGGGPFRTTLNLATVAPILEKAFAIKDAPAVAIAINSPGGSPVQSRLIFQRIRDLSSEKNKRVLVFVEDVAASGGYMIALAGDEIFADPTSIVGSIGVVSGGFGFPELLRKIGVERRVYTAGENKVILDPFKPERESDIDYLKSLQVEIHDVFIGMVKERRGPRLSSDPDLFSGLFWTGQRGLALGLIDGIADMRAEIRRRYGDDARLQLISPARGLFGRKIPGVGAEMLAGSAEQVAVAGISALAEIAEEKALWSRYGR
ncbi:serine protease SohB [Mycoplana sp. BE70]|nr:serine protease SohB [Mycoplana sp. BE70]